MNNVNINYDLVYNLNKAWPNRASVCAVNKAYAPDSAEGEKPDYPEEMTPFFYHPEFEKLDKKIKDKVLTWGWIAYNKRTIDAENYIVNPAFGFIANSGLLGRNRLLYCESMQQAIIDESYHTLMHFQAIQRTKSEKNLEENIDIPVSVTYLKLKEINSTLTEAWQKKMASIVFAIVAEISVNAYLEIIAENKTIKDQNSLIARMHNRDEYAHGKILCEIGKDMYCNMSPVQRDFFIKMLPEALKSFLVQDFSVWKIILKKLNIPNHELILNESVSKNNMLTRDFSGIFNLAKQLEITDRLDFVF